MCWNKLLKAQGYKLSNLKLRIIIILPNDRCEIILPLPIKQKTKLFSPKERFKCPRHMAEPIRCQNRISRSHGYYYYHLNTYSSHWCLADFSYYSFLYSLACLVWSLQHLCFMNFQYMSHPSVYTFSNGTAVRIYKPI